MFGISALLYTNVIYVSILVVTLIGYFKISAYTGNGIIGGCNQVKWMGPLVIILILFLGLRPLSPVFADTMNYAQQYRFAQQGISLNYDSAEWLFDYLLRTFAKFTSVDYFFLMIEIFYILPMFIACKRLHKDNSDYLMLFCIGAFSFYTYAVNGLRQGVGCSLLMLALTYIGKGKRGNIVFIILSFLAMGFHSSSALPAVAAVFAFYYKKPVGMFYFWLISIGISLIAGEAVSAFFSGIGFDDRMEGYLGENVILDDGAVFSHTGFRWDFLLYSAMPVLLGWYVIIKRKFLDDAYHILLATYIYSNAFWIMVIRAPFSNRFAYLSWFLYPLVLAYPLFRFSVFEQRHSQKTAVILLGHFGFTFFMWLIGK